MRTGFLALVCATFASGAMAEERSIIVLDGSGSMWGQIDGRPKLDIARDALGEVLAGIPADTSLGFMAYGHRNKGDCSDIELIVPPAPGSAPAISAAAAKMRFLGKTPLSEAVRRAAAEMRATEDKATVILITDGIETCAADPCAVATELESQGVDFTAHVVGFGLTKEEGRQVACLAENTGGKYIEAQDAGSLVEALKTTVATEAKTPQPTEPPKPKAMPENFAPRLLFTGGTPVPEDAGNSWELFAIGANGPATDSTAVFYGAPKVQVEPGRYLLVARLGQARSDMEIEIGATGLATPEMEISAAYVEIVPQAEPGGPAIEGAPSVLTAPTGDSATLYGAAGVWMPAGPIAVEVTVGTARVQTEITAAPGERLRREIVAAAGTVIVDGFLAPGNAGTGTLVVEIYARTPDGTRGDLLVYGYGPEQRYDLAPGPYLAVGRMQFAETEQPFEIVTGETRDIDLALNGGTAIATAEGADHIEVFALSETDEPTSLGYEYGARYEVTLSTGRYRMIAYRGDKQSAADIDITPGSTVEISLP
ncbi:vWA domain-containing protein [Gemmobacter lutimaris]|nr:VWA domain-containing protein [Gemmobacter lutimaris]